MPKKRRHRIKKDGKKVRKEGKDKRKAQKANRNHKARVTIRMSVSAVDKQGEDMGLDVVKSLIMSLEDRDVQWG